MAVGFRRCTVLGLGGRGPPFSQHGVRLSRGEEAMGTLWDLPALVRWVAGSGQWSGQSGMSQVLAVDPGRDWGHQDPRLPA